MSDPNGCERCGCPLPQAGPLGGVCPPCMLELGLESTPGSPEGPDNTVVAARLAPKDPSVAPHPLAIAGYRILRLIGEGGMGAVYEAEQDHPRRIVALKIIRPGTASSELLRRFEQESQALGRLQHPGIAQIYEAGTADTGFGPRPYFAMEFIRGKTLKDYAEAHHLNTRQRLEMVANIAEAVQHAHQRGLIHRDLKPGNILVDETGHPRILDFGVVRATDSDAQASRQTDMGQLVGTLAYMSPEQALADPLELDTRTDVYALGVILYELLAGRLPYTIGKKLHETIHAIRQEDPAKLSAVSRSYRGDIETIVAKALEKDKARRYASAAELAADIQRYLKDEPIVARPPSASYQLQKFARRHKALVTGVSGVFVALVAGVVAFAWMANLYRLERDQADIEASKARAVLDFVGVALFGMANPYAQGDSGQPNQARTSPRPNITLKEALDLSVKQIPLRFDGQPLQEAAIREFVADTYIGIGRYSEGQDQLERAVALRRREQGYTNAETLQATVKLADAYANLRMYSTAEDLAKQVVNNARRTPGEVDPYVKSAVNTLVTIYSGAVNTDQSRGFSQVERFLKNDVVDYQRRKSGESDSTVQFAILNLLSLYTDSKPPKYPDAEAFMKQIADVRRSALGEGDPATLNAEKQLIGLYLIPQPQPKYAEAEAYLKPLIEAQRHTLGDDNPATQATINYLVSAYLSQPQPRYAEAENFLQRVKEDAHRRLGNESSAVRNASIGLANVYFKQARYPEAADLLTPFASNSAVEKAMAHSVALEIQPPILNNLDRSQIYGEPGNFAPADSMARLTQTEQPTILDILDLLAQIFDKQGNSAAATAMANELRTLLETALHSARNTGPGGEKLLTALKSTGAIAIRYIDRDRSGEAEELLNTVVEGYRQLTASYAKARNSATPLVSVAKTTINPGNGSQVRGYRQLAESNTNAGEIATLLTSAAITYTRKGNDRQAEKLLKAVLEIDHVAMGDDDWYTQRSLWRLASWYMDRGRYKEAHDTYDRLNKIQIAFYGPAHTMTRTTMVDMTVSYAERFQIELAEGRRDRLQLLLEANLDIRNRLLVLYRSEPDGEKSGNTRLVMSGAGIVLAMLGRYAPAAETFAQLDAIQKSAEGVEQEARPVALANLGWTQFHQQKFPEAEASLREALRRYEEIQSDTWERYNTESMLGAALVATRKYEEAERHLLNSYEKVLERKPRPGLVSGFTAESEPGERIVRLFQEWGKTDKVAVWTRRIEANKLAVSAEVK